MSSNNVNDDFENAFKTDENTENMAENVSVDEIDHLTENDQNLKPLSKNEEKKRVMQHLINNSGGDASLESTLDDEELAPIFNMVNNVFEKDFTFKDIADNPDLREQMYYVLFSSYGDLNARIISLGKTLTEMSESVQHFTTGLDDAKAMTAKEINASKQDFMNFMNSKELQLNTISTTAISVIYNTLSKRIEHQVLAIEAQTKALKDRNDVIEQKIDTAIENLNTVAEKSLSESVMKTVNKNFYKMIGIIVIMQALITIGIYTLVKSGN